MSIAQTAQKVHAEPYHLEFVDIAEQVQGWIDDHNENNQYDDMDHWGFWDFCQHIENNVQFQDGLIVCNYPDGTSEKFSLWQCDYCGYYILGNPELKSSIECVECL